MFEAFSPPGIAARSHLMPTVTVYYFRQYDIADDKFLTSKRPATRETITKLKGEPIEESKRKVDVSHIDLMGFSHVSTQPNVLVRDESES